MNFTTARRIGSFGLSWQIRYTNQAGSHFVNLTIFTVFPSSVSWITQGARADRNTTG